MADGNGSTEAEIRKAQRTEEGARFRGALNKIRARLQTDKAFREERDAEVRALHPHNVRNVAPGQVHANAFLSNLSKMYKNDEYIGELVMPPLPVDNLNGTLPTFDKRDRTAAPDDAMGSRSDANALNETRGSDSFLLQGYALKNSVPAATLRNQDPGFNEMMQLTMALDEALALKREIRIATVVQTAANYSGNTVTLAGADQWSSGGGGDPIGAILTGASAVWGGGGPGQLIGVTSIDAWNIMTKHPAILDLFKNTMPGLTKADRLAQEVGLDRIIIGKARKDTANPGQSASYSRIWGKDFSIVRVSTVASLFNATFGYTMRRTGDPITNQWFDPTKGVDGAYFAQVGQFEQHKVIAGDAGYCIKACVA